MIHNTPYGMEHLDINIIQNRHPNSNRGFFFALLSYFSPPSPSDLFFLSHCASTPQSNRKYRHRFLFDYRNSTIRHRFRKESACIISKFLSSRYHHFHRGDGVLNVPIIEILKLLLSKGL